MYIVNYLKYIVHILYCYFSTYNFYTEKEMNSLKERNEQLNGWNRQLMFGMNRIYVTGKKEFKDYQVIDK